jgi:hypothetical protein
MCRRVLALTVALVCSPAILYAQDVVFTVGVSSADVYKGPSNVTPVIGHVSRGTAMPVLRNLGSWIRVPWPAAPDGIGYVHITTGRLTSPNAGGVTPPTATPPSPQSPRREPPPPAAQMAPAPQPRSAPRDRVVVRSGQDGTAISHVWGVGGVVGSTSTFGATARAWRDNRLGLQIGFTRDAMTSPVAAGRVTAVQVEPAVVYGLHDFISDYFWIRPYIGSGIGIRHETMHDASPAAAEVTSNGVGWRAFGGGELTFAGLPRFALSVEAGYRRLPAPFAGFEADRFAASISGHWYIK